MNITGTLRKDGRDWKVDARDGRTYILTGVRVQPGMAGLTVQVRGTALEEEGFVGGAFFDGPVTLKVDNLLVV